MFDSLRFLGRLVTQPKTLGAVAPSSRALGRAMAAQIDPAMEGPVLELGPGTGVATEALIARGIAADRIVAVEYDPQFAQLIASRF
ncbi:MAG: phospholipid methyltransferase, partial [Alphaproteobacteria bacterium]|nr:phospholipid methyltransferase [Alphaproteobacteria bacterium]